MRLFTHTTVATIPVKVLIPRYRQLSTTTMVKLRIRLDDQGNSATVPDKPQPVDPDLCCMSGCARCVWDIYAEELQAYEEGLRNLRQELTRNQQPEPRLLTRLIQEIDSGELARNDGGSGGGPDASMRAFMQMEQKIKQKAS